MRTHRCGAAVFVVLLLAGGAGAGDANTKLMQEVTEFGDALAAAMLDHDVETMLAMYSENAISLPNYGPRMQGLDALRKAHQEQDAAGMKVTAFESEPTEAWECGNQVIEIGTFTISLDMPGMPGIKDQGKYVTIYERDSEGALKVKVETWNTDMNPTGMGDGTTSSN